MKKAKDAETEIRELEEKVRAAREKVNSITTYLNSLALPASRGEATSIALQREQNAELDTANVTLRYLEIALSQARKEKEGVEKLAAKAEADRIAADKRKEITAIKQGIVSAAERADRALAAAVEAIEEVKAGTRAWSTAEGPDVFPKLRTDQRRMNHVAAFHRLHEIFELLGPLPGHQNRRSFAGMALDAVGESVFEEKAS